MRILISGVPSFEKNLPTKGFELVRHNCDYSYIPFVTWGYERVLQPDSLDSSSHSAPHCHMSKMEPSQAPFPLFVKWACNSQAAVSLASQAQNRIFDTKSSPRWVGHAVQQAQSPEGSRPVGTHWSVGKTVFIRRQLRLSQELLGLQCHFYN